MNRARINALALVNWRGVFYERYLLDRHVTALEGANGAGKTTVMVAAYVALLPDLSRLRFTNVGESGATGGDRGIWGRLGEPGRPAYTVLDLELAGGQRLIAGVRLRRLSEPSVEATTWIARGLAPEVPLADLLLVRTEDVDHVAELDEIKQAVKRHGGALEQLRSTKEYFAALFEAGVTPLRLATDDDRSKLNEMLRTSMSGGISRVLTTELRSFLLKAEVGLGDVLGRMRENLEACRRTRAEVAEARVLERDISSVYEAGQAMLSAAHGALQHAAAEADRSAAQARDSLAAAEREVAELAAAATALSVREATLEQELGVARAAERDQAARLERLHKARELAAHSAKLAAECETRSVAARLSAATLAAAAAERESARIGRDRLHEAHQRAALGLAQLQDGLDELHRRAYAYREFGRALGELSALAARPDLDASAVPELRERLARDRDTLQAERARRQRDRDGAEARRLERQRAELALDALESSTSDVRAILSPGMQAATAEPLPRARAVLAQLDELASEVGRLGQLNLEAAELERAAARQRESWAQATAFGVACGPSVDARAALAQQAVAGRRARERADYELAEAQAEVDAASARLAQFRQNAEALRTRSEHWPALSAAAQLLGTFDLPLADRAQLLGARERLLEESAELVARRRQLQEQRDEATRLAGDLAGAGSALDPALVRLRDELGGDLLLERFDDTPVEHAAALEAALGPLAGALVVDDPLASARAIAGKPRSSADVWLVPAGTDLELADEIEVTGGDVVRVERFGVRITRISEHPALGARARAARATAMRERAELSAGALEACAQRARQLGAAQRALDTLYEAQAMWFAGDPMQARAALEAEQQALAAAEATANARLAVARDQRLRAQAALDACDRLDAVAHLFDGTDHAHALSRVRARIAAVQRAHQVLAANAEHRHTLRGLLDALRAPSAPESDLSSAATELERLDTELERSYRAIAAADSVLAQRHAKGWSDAVERLGTESALLPQLEAQHDEARLAVARADRQVIDADACWERAASAAHGDAAEHAVAAAAAARVADQLHDLGGAPDDALIADARAEVTATERRSAELTQAGRSLIAELARTRERAERSAGARAAAQRDADAAVAALAPAREAWLSMQSSAQQAGLELRPNAEVRRGAAALSAEADAQRSLLIERLTRSRGGADAAREIESQRDALAAWVIARAWLLRRVPVQIAGHDHPLRALERLRDDLGGLEQRLERQELDLRGASGDIARGIDVQLRRAATQVRRLNERIAHVQFGNIEAIRVQLRRVDRMEQILRALREGEAQELLFLQSIPVEEALEEIFRRYGGGRGGGQRLLDYREYLELAVEIRRKTSETWELASPAKLSTGEAIGVGAALMMVVLAEWERDANLLRARAAAGSLRFLFLDEANRLSRDNLGVLFELCKTLELQLLIAAPEIARAEGNTTYRLVRHIADDGREEVIVSGRRAIAATDLERDPQPAASDAGATSEVHAS